MQSVAKVAVAAVSLASGAVGEALAEQRAMQSAAKVAAAAVSLASEAVGEVLAERGQGGSGCQPGWGGSWGGSCRAAGPAERCQSGSGVASE
ncbi:UNVERIFIED_CONTAM: hypothetical protein K2H54_050168, partial [Gekko kuhli]